MTTPMSVTKYTGDFDLPIKPVDIEELAKESAENDSNLVVFVSPTGQWGYARFQPGSEYPEADLLQEISPIPGLVGGYNPEHHIVGRLNHLSKSCVEVPDRKTYLFGTYDAHAPPEMQNVVGATLTKEPVSGPCAITYGTWSKGGKNKVKALLAGDCRRCGRPMSDHHPLYGSCPADAYFEHRGIEEGEQQDFDLNGRYLDCLSGSEDSYRYMSSDPEEPDLDEVCDNCGCRAWDHYASGGRIPSTKCPGSPAGGEKFFKGSSRYRRHSDAEDSE